MAKKRITSRPGLFGMVYHYDESGKIIGKTRPGLFGDRKIHFDAAGHQIGTSRPGLWAKEVRYDKRTKSHISSYDTFFGEVHRSNGRTVGKTVPGLFDTEYSSLEDEVVSLYDDQSCEEYFWDEDTYPIEDFFQFITEEDQNSEDNETQRSEHTCHKSSVSNRATTRNRGPANILRRIVGLLGVIGCIFSGLLTVDSIASGNSPTVNIVTFALCCFLFGKMAVYGFKRR